MTNPTKITKNLMLLAFLAMPMLTNAEESPVASLVLQAAGQGDVKSQAKLGAMYLLGQGLEKDEQKAAAWFLKAAQQGHLQSQAIVAALYDSGRGFSNDVKAATQWYEKAAAQGHAPSLAILGKNAVAKGGVAFSYQSMRLRASQQIPEEYAKQLLLSR